MVADRRLNHPSSVGRLLLERHNQLQDSDAVGTSIDHIADQDERALAAGPVVTLVQQVACAQKPLQWRKISVDITDDQYALAHRGLSTRIDNWLTMIQVACYDRAAGGLWPGQSTADA